MKRLGRNLLILLGIGVLIGPAWGPAAVAGERTDVNVDRHGKVKVVVIDDDGERHEEVFEFDGDHPRPFLGVMLDGDHEGGARIDDVIADTAADRAGLKAGDVIVSVDGENVDGSWDLTHELLKHEPGDRVDIELLRDGTRQTVTAELGRHEGGGFAFGFDPEALEQQMEQLQEHLEDLDLDFDFDDDSLHGGPHRFFVRAQRPKLGVQLIEPTRELREHYGSAPDEGILIGKVLPDTPAAEAGLQVGDLIVAVDGERIRDAGDLRRSMRDKDGLTLDIEIVRDGLPMTLQATLREKDDDAGRQRNRQRFQTRPALRLDQST